MRHQGKVALVTGGRSGIGQAIARRLREDGARVWTAQRGRDADFEHVEADLADADAPARVVAEVVAAAGRLDIVVNNAGYMVEARAEAMGLDAWERMIRVNLTAPFLLIRAALPHLRATRGAIVNIGSIEGIGCNPEHAAYSATKAGLHGLTRAIAVDEAGHGIRINAVAPGWIDTDLSEAYVASTPDPEAFQRRLGRLHPVGRTGRPDDVAAVVSWLASDDAAFVAGQTFVVDGGRTVKLPLPL